MPLYRVMKPSFINNIYHEEGTEIEFEGEVADNLELVHPPKKHPQHRAPAHTDESLA